MKVGGEEAQAFAEKLGISIEETYPSYAIGGFKKGISPLQLSGAYAAFGSGGNFHQPYSVEKVVYPNGKEMKLASESERAMSEGTAYMITDMLRTVVNEGTGMQAAIDGLDVAGKTGTTNLDDSINGEGTSDEWFSGYTTNYTVSIWTGYDKTTQKTYVHKKDDDIAKLLFHHIMSKVSEGKETSSFKKPDSVVELKIDEQTGLRANKATPSSQIVKELFFKGEEPEKSAIPEPKKKEPVKQQKDQTDKKKDNEKQSSNQPAAKTETKENKQTDSHSNQTETKEEKNKKEPANKEPKTDPVEESSNQSTEDPANDPAEKPEEKQQTEEPDNGNKNTGDSNEDSGNSGTPSEDAGNDEGTDNSETDQIQEIVTKIAVTPILHQKILEMMKALVIVKQVQIQEIVTKIVVIPILHQEIMVKQLRKKIMKKVILRTVEETSDSTEQDQSGDTAEESQNGSADSEPVEDSDTSESSAQEDPANAPDKKEDQGKTTE